MTSQSCRDSALLFLFGEFETTARFIAQILAILHEVDGREGLEGLWADAWAIRSEREPAEDTGQVHDLIGRGIWRQRISHSKRISPILRLKRRVIRIVHRIPRRREF